MDRGRDDGAGDEDDCEDGGETSNGQEGFQGSHDRHSRVLRGTLHGDDGRRDYAFLRAYAYTVENLNAA